MIKYLKKSLLVSCVWDVYISIINNKNGNNCSGGMGTFIYIYITYYNYNFNKNALNIGAISIS